MLKGARWGSAALVLLVAVAVSAGANPSYGAETPQPIDAKPTPREDDPLPLDLTGDAALSEERDRLQGLLSPLSATDGGMIWDPDSGVLTIRMTTDAALKQAEAIISGSHSDITTKFEVVRYTAAELDQLADRLLGNQLEWAGVAGIGGGHSPADNRVVLEVDPNYKDGPAQIDAIKKLNDPRVELHLIEPVENWAPESREDDFEPWAAGATIIAPSGALCTLGWNWRRWSNSQIVGSTARHCANLTWYNNGTWVGTVFQSHQATDSALMSGTTNSPIDYSPSVFVGGTVSNPNTSVSRYVIGVDTNWIAGDQVAMSGATTGLNTNTVKYPTYTLPSCTGEYAGLVGVLMQNHSTAPGDSGGPWLTTQTGTGYVYAHGQHFGHGCATGNSGSFFIKLSAISAAQGVSLLVH